MGVLAKYRFTTLDSLDGTHHLEIEQILGFLCLSFTSDMQIINLHKEALKIFLVLKKKTTKYETSRL